MTGALTAEVEDDAVAAGRASVSLELFLELFFFSDDDPRGRDGGASVAYPNCIDNRFDRSDPRCRSTTRGTSTLSPVPRFDGLPFREPAGDSVGVRTGVRFFVGEAFLIGRMIGSLSGAWNSGTSSAEVLSFRLLRCFDEGESSTSLNGVCDALGFEEIAGLEGEATTTVAFGATGSASFTRIFFGRVLLDPA
jgi:hypothetical protein